MLNGLFVVLEAGQLGLFAGAHGTGADGMIVAPYRRSVGPAPDLFCHSHAPTVGHHVALRQICA